MENNNSKYSDNRPSEHRNHNVRQLGSANTSSSNQGQILSALDILGAKLVRSESERETMRKLLNEALEAQDRFETQLERSQINIQRRIDQIEGQAAKLSDEDKAFIEEQKSNAIDAKKSINDQLTRQLKLEDRLRDSQQTIAKLQRRLDTQEQKRAKLQRRVERVENIAADAQNALEAKAMVLLTNQSESLRHLPQIDASAPMAVLDNLHMNDNLPDTQSSHWANKFKSSLTGGTSWMVVLGALGLGWAIATSFQPSDKAFVMMRDGQMAQVNLRDGTAQKIAFMSEPLEFNTQTAIQESQLKEEITSLETEWITDDIINSALNDVTSQDIKTSPTPAAYDVLETVTMPEITMDRDLTLPDEIKDLESKAFANIPEAQHDMAALYTAGQAGVKQNYERAAFWFKQAAEQGIGNAAYNLGVLYQQGLGQAQDLQRALDWYRRAAQLGHPEAQYNLGIAYIEGVGTRYNPSMAAAFFQQAAFGGISEAAYNLGLILENGLLGEVRPEDALKWYRAAAENGNIEAEQSFKALASEMNIPETAAGLLENGQSLAAFTSPLNDLEPAAGSLANDRTLFNDAGEDISLGTLVPTKDQILVAQIQEQLRKNNLYNGPQDGIVGEGTVKAIKTYQSQNNLPADGLTTPELLTFMLQQGT